MKQRSLLDSVMIVSLMSNTRHLIALPAQRACLHSAARREKCGGSSLRCDFVAFAFCFNRNERRR
jgi:hypothetical protein